VGALQHITTVSIRRPDPAHSAEGKKHLQKILPSSRSYLDALNCLLEELLSCLTSRDTIPLITTLNTGSMVMPHYNWH